MKTNQRQKNLEYFRLHCKKVHILFLVIAVELVYGLFFQIGIMREQENATTILGIILAGIWAMVKMPNFFIEEEVFYRKLPVSESAMLGTWTFEPLLIGEIIPAEIFIVMAISKKLTLAYAAGLCIIMLITWLVVEMIFIGFLVNAVSFMDEASKISKALPVTILIIAAFVGVLVQRHVMNIESLREAMVWIGFTGGTAFIIHRINKAKV